MCFWSTVIKQSCESSLPWRQCSFLRNSTVSSHVSRVSCWKYPETFLSFFWYSCEITRQRNRLKCRKCGAETLHWTDVVIVFAIRIQAKDSFKCSAPLILPCLLLRPMAKDTAKGNKSEYFNSGGNTGCVPCQVVQQYPNELCKKHNIRKPNNSAINHAS